MCVAPSFPAGSEGLRHTTFVGGMLISACRWVLQLSATTYTSRSAGTLASICLEKLRLLLVTMTGRALRERRAASDVQRGRQRRGSMTHTVVRQEPR
jgi:hypothetical protein